MLTDTDPMPFGRYKGEAMQDVPVTYLHWLYHNCNPSNSNNIDVLDYIRRSIDGLKLENKDLIWSK